MLFFLSTCRFDLSALIGSALTVLNLVVLVPEGARRLNLTDPSVSAAGGTQVLVLKYGVPRYL